MKVSFVNRLTDPQKIELANILQREKLSESGIERVVELRNFRVILECYNGCGFEWIESLDREPSSIWTLPSHCRLAWLAASEEGLSDSLSFYMAW